MGGGGGGGYRTGKVTSEFLPLPKKRREAQKVVSILKGDTANFKVVLTQELEVSAILNWGGGAQNVSDPRFSHFVSPLPMINDQFLSRVGKKECCWPLSSRGQFELPPLGGDSIANSMSWP